MVLVGSSTHRRGQFVLGSSFGGAPSGGVLGSQHEIVLVNGVWTRAKMHYDHLGSGILDFDPGMGDGAYWILLGRNHVKSSFGSLDKSIALLRYP